MSFGSRSGFRRMRFRKAHWKKSVVVRGVRADVHPLIAVPHYAGVRVVSGIVVGISRRETQTCACYERHKATTSKAGHTKTPADGGGANPWGNRGRAEPGANRACAEPRAKRGRAEPATKRACEKPRANRGRAEPGTQRGSAEPRANRGRAEPGTNRGRAEPWANRGRADPNTPEATTDGRAPEATAAKSTPAEATTLSKSPLREHRCQYQGRGSSKPKSFHGRLLHTTVSSLRTSSPSRARRAGGDD